MTRDQIAEVKISHPVGYEAVIAGFYESTTAELIKEIVRWMPKSEFMKLVAQAEKLNGGD